MQQIKRFTDGQVLWDNGDYRVVFYAVFGFNLQQKSKFTGKWYSTGRYSQKSDYFMPENARQF